jgi:nicotinamidase-related amidase
MPRTVKLDRQRAAVLIIDVQERLVPAIEPEAFARVVKYSRALIGTAKEMGIPVIGTEQYPKGLGPMVREITELLPSPALSKVTFSCVADEGFAKTLAATGRKQIIVAGMETHVCVFQTVRDLVAAGYEVHLCADAVGSRTTIHRKTGVDLAREVGAIITTAETAIFDLLHQAGTPEFKKVSPLVK